MQSFTRDTWTEDDSQRARERVARFDDGKLKQHLEACEFMCNPRGRPVRESYIIQREIGREERLAESGGG